jgi:hypothetical protein
MNAAEIKAAYPGYTGWNDTAAIEADFRATGGVGKGGPTSSGGGSSGGQSLADLNQQILDMRIKANQPAIAGLEASIPGVSATYEHQASALEGEKQPIKDRYQTLIDEITRKETKETTTQGNILASEYGKRGIPVSSTAYQQDLAGKTGDISQYYTGLEKETVLGREADLRDVQNQIVTINDQKVQAENAIRNKIAELQAGGAGQAVTDAVAMYGAQKQREFDSRLDDLNKKLTEAQIAQSNQKSYMTVGEGQAVFDPVSGKSLFYNPKIYNTAEGKPE